MSASSADLSTQLAAAQSRIADLEQQLATARATSDHPIHSILSKIEAEVLRPEVLLVSEVRNLINRARALF